MVNWFSEKMPGQFNAETIGGETIWYPYSEREHERVRMTARKREKKEGKRKEEKRLLAKMEA